MLYYISEKTVELAERNNSSVINMLDNLYLAWRNGRCLIDSSRDNLQRLSEINKGYISILKSKQGLRDIYQKIDFYVILLFNTSIEHDNSPKVIEKAIGHYLDFYKINDERLFSNNNLLCEHVEDAEIYSWGSSFYIDTETRNVRLNVTEQQGGGHAIRDIAKNYNEHKQLTLCLLDSDKCHPKDSMGQTANDFTIQFKNVNTPFLWYYVINAHEIENIIPFPVLNNCGILPKKFITNHVAVDFSDPVIGMFFRYWDSKEGFKPSDLRCIRDNYPQSLPKVINLLMQYGVKQCRIMNELSRGYNPERNAALLHGFGYDTLSKAAEYVKYVPNDISIFKIDAYQKKVWLRISRLVWSIGCAIKPKRV